MRHILPVIFNPSFLYFLFPALAFFTVSNTRITFKLHGWNEHSSFVKGASYYDPDRLQKNLSSCFIFP